MFIYVIASREEGPCKIGFAKSPESRLRQLQTGHPERLTLWFTQEIKHENVRRVEKIIHESVKFDRSTGEWFRIDVAAAIAEVTFAAIRHDPD